MSPTEEPELSRKARTRALERLSGEIEKAREENPIVVARALGSAWATEDAKLAQLVALEAWARRQKPGSRIEDAQRLTELPQALGVTSSFWDKLPPRPESSSTLWNGVDVATLTHAFVQGALRIFSLLKRELEARDILPPELPSP